jgi:hypothetical protein
VLGSTGCPGVYSGSVDLLTRHSSRSSLFPDRWHCSVRRQGNCRHQRCSDRNSRSENCSHHPLLCGCSDNPFKITEVTSIPGGAKRRRAQRAPLGIALDQMSDPLTGSRSLATQRGTSRRYFQRPSSLLITLFLYDRLFLGVGYRKNIQFLPLLDDCPIAITLPFFDDCLVAVTITIWFDYGGLFRLPRWWLLA